ncbi:sigma-70 family RNA polymerase sigma factor [Massilia sp. 9096]|uniref:sigma-70 family RNA polymerase sigma factor n=1 Tax=Massilia sp. 9096 TaxID=1500894 RepID=UPI00056568D5|nr:sigma-70 family RNA polymerase sigma factor [Massilia sp. 9096]
MHKDIDESDRLRRLLSAVALGDRGAFRTLYDATSARLYGCALRVLPQESLAEEALQDAFVAIWHAASTYQPHLAAPATWMATIVRNKALDVRRRLQASGESDGARYVDELNLDPLAALQDAAAGPQERLQMSRDAQALARCLETLASRQRQAICMAYLHDLSHGDVAAQLDTPLGTVKTWIRRGLERLRVCLTTQEAA